MRQPCAGEGVVARKHDGHVSAVGQRDGRGAVGRRGYRAGVELEDTGSRNGEAFLDVLRHENHSVAVKRNVGVAFPHRVDVRCPESRVDGDGKLFLIGEQAAVDVSPEVALHRDIVILCELVGGGAAVHEKLHRVEQTLGGGVFAYEEVAHRQVVVCGRAADGENLCRLRCGAGEVLHGERLRRGEIFRRGDVAVEEVQRVGDAGHGDAGLRNRHAGVGGRLEVVGADVELPEGTFQRNGV